MQIKCAHCGNMFTASGVSSAKRKHCSRDCLVAAKNKTSTCEVCYKLFKHYRTRDARFCSVGCKGIASQLWANCLHCGASFKPSVRDGLRAKFCSRDCSAAARKFRQYVPCEVCGKSTLQPRRYCSRACHSVYQGRNKVAFNCKTCGGEFKWSPSRVLQRPKYCSIECRTVCPDWRRNAAIEGNRIQSRRRTPSKLEQAGAEILRGLGVEFKEQVLVEDRFLVDVVIDGTRIVVQWDGDYWHGYRAAGDTRPLDSRQRRRQNYDYSQDAYMHKYGYLVLRFWEHEVMRSPQAVAKAIADVHSAVAKSKNNLERPEDLPLFSQLGET